MYTYTIEGPGNRWHFRPSDVDDTSDKLEKLRRDIDSQKDGAKEALQQFEEQSHEHAMMMREVCQKVLCDCPRKLIELPHQ